MLRSLSLSLLLATGLSCGGAVDSLDAPLDPVEPPAATEEGAPLAAVASDRAEAAPTEEPSAPTLAPRGVYPSIAALCAAQVALAGPHVRQAREDMRDLLGDDHIEPGCIEVPSALRDARVEAGGPFLEVRAVAFETGHATATHLVARTVEGWVAVQDAIERDHHFDPGCPSIERDGGLLSARVLGDGEPALVLVTTTNRYTVDDDGVEASHVVEHARACRLEGEGRSRSVACDPPESIAEKVVLYAADQAPPTEVYRAEFGVDARGGLVVARGGAPAP